MEGSPRTVMARVIPNRSNRSLWWLIAAISAPSILLGGVVSALMYHMVYGTDFLSSLMWMMIINTGSVFIALGVSALWLNRTQRILGSWSAVFLVITAGVAASVFKSVVIRTGVLLEFEAFPKLDAPFFLLHIIPGVIILLSIAVAVVYGGVRERALRDAFQEVSRAQVSLAREEEQVREEVFDHLHGTLQAHFVAIQQTLLEVEATTSDGAAAQAAHDVAAELQRIYREEVQQVTRTLVPSGLQAGLGIAFAELATRLTGGIDVDVSMDPIVAIMDDPMAGGIHHDTRLAAYRITEEAVSNAMEHSQARYVTVNLGSHLADGAAHIDLEIGHRIDAPVVVVEGQGLLRMRARAGAIGGTVDYRTESDRFVVRASLPLARPQGVG